MISQAEITTAPSLSKSPTLLPHQKVSSSPQPQSPGNNNKHSNNNNNNNNHCNSNHNHHHHNHHHHNHHHPSSKANPPPASSPLHNTTSSSTNSVKTQKSASVKKRKRFDETILDGFSIIAFKTWEDLQDELNERSSSLITANTAAAADSASGNSYDHNVVKKASSKSRHKCSSSSSSSLATSTFIGLDTNPVTNSNGAPKTTTSVATTTTTNSGQHHHHHNHKDTVTKKKKKKEKVREKSPSLGSLELQPKEKRNKTSSSDKTTLKKALEAKELAEKRLSILQKKLELEQSKNRSTHIDSSDHQDHEMSNQKTTSIVPEHYSSTHTTSEHILRNDDMMINTSGNVNCNNSIGHDQIKEQLGYLNAPKPAPYSPFHINSHLQRTKTIIQQPTHTPPPPMHHPPATHNMSQSHFSQQKQQHFSTSNLLQPHNQHHRTTPPPHQSIHRDPYHPQTPPISSQSSNNYQQRPPLIHSQPQTATHHMIPPQQHNPMHPYSSQPASSIMSSMGLGPLASPYSCPSICITDTISRQTSIIPPIGAALEQSTSQTSTRYGHHHGMMAHPAAHLNPTPHQVFYPMPQTPTERSFMEFVRSYPAPSHMSYPSLMNSFIPPSSLQTGPVAHAPAPPTPLQVPQSAPLTVPPSFTASAYGFERSWPRLALDNQRAAINRYNSIYQATSNPIPERPYASYASGRPPFHAGLFQPPF